MLGGMDSCSSGSIMLDGREVSGFSEKELTYYRRYDIGFVFQFYNLVQNLTALENVELGQPDLRGSRSMRPRCFGRWGWGTAWITSPRSFPAASSNAWPSPVRSRRIRSFCCATSDGCA